MPIEQYSGSLKNLLYYICSPEFTRNESNIRIKLILSSSDQKNVLNDFFLFDEQPSIEQCLLLQNIDLITLDQVDPQNQTGKLFAYFNDLIYQQSTTEKSSQNEPTLVVILYGLLEIFTLQFGELITQYENGTNGGTETDISNGVASQVIPRTHYSAKYLGLLLNKLHMLSDLSSIYKVLLCDSEEIMRRAELVYLPVIELKNDFKVIDFDKLRLQIQDDFPKDKTYVSLKEILNTFDLKLI